MRVHAPCDHSTHDVTAGQQKRKKKETNISPICWQHLLMRSVQGEEKRSDCWHWIFRSGLAMTRNLMVKKWKESEDSKETKIGKGREFFEDGRIKRYVATVFRRDIYILVSFFFTFYETIKVYWESTRYFVNITIYILRWVVRKIFFLSSSSGYREKMWNKKIDRG